QCLTRVVRDESGMFWLGLRQFVLRSRSNEMGPGNLHVRGVHTLRLRWRAASGRLGAELAVRREKRWGEANFRTIRKEKLCLVLALVQTPGRAPHSWSHRGLQSRAKVRPIRFTAAAWSERPGQSSAACG